MIDTPQSTGSINGFIIDMKVPDVLINQTLCSMKLPKPVKHLSVVCHEGFIVVSIALQKSIITKTIDLKLEITSIKLDSEELIIVFRDLGRNTRIFTGALQLMGITTLFGAVFQDDMISVNLSDKWQSIIRNNIFLNQVFYDVSMTSYSTIKHHMLVKISNTNQGD